jgi:FtsH-binding integral membrane protein
MNPPPANYNSTQYAPNAANHAPTDIEQNYEPKEFNAQLRLGFIRKVYGILTAQLLFTVFMCGLTFIPAVNSFFRHNIVLFWICLVLAIAILIPLVCFQSIARKTPTNYILLGAFTFCEVYMIATCCSFYNPKVVIAAVSLTAAISIGLTIYACTTKTDFTWMGGLLFVSVILLICLGLFCLFLPFLHTLYCVLGVFIFSLYLIFDTQLILGKFGVEYEIDDYIIAALNLYIDIINIFLYLLQLLR